MKKLLLILLLLPTLALAQTPAQELELLLNNLKTLQTEFSQVVTDAQGEVLQESSGKMMIQKPGKFRWSTDLPTDQLIIADGKKLWIYDRDLEQVIIKPMKKTIGDSPALLLSGKVEHLSNDYAVEKSGADHFQLTPTAENTPFQKITLSFKNKVLKSMDLADHLGQSTNLTFKVVKQNQALTANLFQFTPPKGVDVINYVD